MNNQAPKAENPDDEGKLIQGYRLWGGFLTWGWQFAITLGLLTWGGYWLDKELETKVLFTLIGIFMGLIGGFVRLYKLISRLPKSKYMKENDTQNSDYRHKK